MKGEVLIATACRRVNDERDEHYASGMNCLQTQQVILKKNLPFTADMFPELVGTEVGLAHQLASAISVETGGLDDLVVTDVDSHVVD